jgi:uncharacterized protein
MATPLFGGVASARDRCQGPPLTTELWPTAYRFEPGHRIRLQVASGAHPRLARNTGSSEPLSTATKLVAADQQVFHDPLHPSVVVLTVLD